MSFLDKLKSGLKKATDRVTGGYGKVEISLGEGQFFPGQTLPLTVRLSATDAFRANRITLRIREFEKADFRSEARTKDGWLEQSRGSFQDDTSREEAQLAGELSLQPGDCQEFCEEGTLPEDCQPSYHGRWFEHGYLLEARVEVPWGAPLVHKLPLRVVLPALQVPLTNTSPSYQGKRCSHRVEFEVVADTDRGQFRCTRAIQVR